MTAAQHCKAIESLTFKELTINRGLISYDVIT